MNVTCVKPNLPFSSFFCFLSCRSKTRSRRTRGKRRSTWSSLTHPQPTTPTSLQTGTTRSSALRWTRPCPVRLVRWGSWEENLKGVGVVLSACWRRNETLVVKVIYVTEAWVHKLSPLNIHSFFGYWLLSYPVLLSSFVYPVSIPYFSLFLNLYILRTPYFLYSRPSSSSSFLASFLYCFPFCLTGPVPLFSRGADPQPVCMSVCAPVHGQISLSSELQPGSLPPDADADESSSDMLVIVDDPVSSAPQSRATNSPSSVTGSVSDNMNGERANKFQLTFDLHNWGSGAVDCLAASVLFQDRTRINIIIFTLQKKLSNLVTVTQVLIKIPLLIHRRTFYSTKFIRQLKLLFMLK